jgi:hypothetical protein
MIGLRPPIINGSIGCTWNNMPRKNRVPATAPMLRRQIEWTYAGSAVRVRTFGPSARQPSPDGELAEKYVGAKRRPSRSSPERASEGWLGVSDDFRNWFIHVA